MRTTFEFTGNKVVLGQKPTTPRVDIAKLRQASNVQLHEEHVFTEVPTSIEQVFRLLTIGVPNPHIYAAGSFTWEIDLDTGIKIHILNRGMSKTTVFELTDDKGRRFFLKNHGRLFIWMVLKMNILASLFAMLHIS